MSPSQKTYRIYCFDGANMTLNGHVLKAQTDAEAIAEAEAGDFGSKCEIWEGRRLVATLEREGTRAADGLTALLS